MFHHEVVSDNVIAMLVKHKTCLTSQAKQMHAGMAQLTGIHAVEVCGILKIYLHIFVFWVRRYTLFYILKNDLCKK